MITEYHCLVFIAWFIGGFVNGLSGMGSVMVAFPILILRLPMLDAVVISGVAASVLSVGQGLLYRKACRLAALPPMLLGCIPGGIVGIFILKFVPIACLQLFTGILLLGYVLWLALHKAGPGHGDSFKWGALAGFLSGAAGSSIGFCGPPAGLYAVYAGWDKKTALGSLCAYSTGTCLVTNILHAIAGFYTPALLNASLYGGSGALLGLLFSIPVSQKISSREFRKILLLTIAAAGSICTVKALMIL